MHVLHLIDLVSSDLLEDVQVELGFLLFEAVDFDKGHQCYDDVSEALHCFLLLL